MGGALFAGKRWLADAFAPSVGLLSQTLALAALVLELVYFAAVQATGAANNGFALKTASKAANP